MRLEETCWGLLKTCNRQRASLTGQNWKKELAAGSSVKCCRDLETDPDSANLKALPGHEAKK